MSWRRAPDPPLAACQGHTPGLAIITETGFGICEDGSIGFSDCVLKQQQRAPVGPNPFTAIKAPSIQGNSPEKTRGTLRSFTRNDDDDELASAMFASLRFGGDGDGRGAKMCTCPDGGKPVPTDGFFDMFSRGKKKKDHADPRDKKIGYTKHDEDDDEDETFARGDGKGIAKHSAGDHESMWDRFKRGAKNTFDGAKKMMRQDEKMNAMVFETVTGIPYSKEAARQHAVIDIFKTFPDGVPTHAEMDHHEIGEAARLTAMLEVARDGVREAVMTGYPLGKVHRDALRHIHEVMSDQKNKNKTLKKGTLKRLREIMQKDDSVKEAMISRAAKVRQIFQQWNKSDIEKWLGYHKKFNGHEKNDVEMQDIRIAKEILKNKGKKHGKGDNKGEAGAKGGAAPRHNDASHPQHPDQPHQHPKPVKPPQYPKTVPSSQDPEKIPLPERVFNDPPRI